MLHKSAGFWGPTMSANRDDLHILDRKQKFRPDEDWHVFPLAIPRRSITGQLVWGKVLRRWDGRKYAQFWASRYGQTASVSARAMANSLKKKGDLGGHKVWIEVAETIDHRVKNKRRPAHQENVAAASSVSPPSQ